MKKISSVVIAVILVFSLFSTTGYAKAVTKKITAVFGSYVIKLNGEAQKTQTLATGSTVYIPINEITLLTGATVKKSSDTFNITPVKKEDGITYKDIATLKHYNEMQDFYKTLDELGDNLFDLSTALGISFDEIMLYKTSNYLNNDFLNRLNTNINRYNTLLNEVVIKVNSGRVVGIYSQADQDNLNQITKLLSNSIDAYKLAYTDLNNFAASQSSYDLGKYHANGKNGYENALKAQELSFNGYQKYYSLIKDY